MTRPVRFAALLVTVGMFCLPTVNLNAERPAPVVTIDETVIQDWNELITADKRVGRLLADGPLADVPAQVEIIKKAVARISHGVHTADETIIKPLSSAVREMIAWADRLAAVAAKGKRSRAQTVFVNLHRYVEFVASHLPEGYSGGSVHHGS